jgi:hypothetical protein
MKILSPQTENDMFSSFTVFIGNSAVFFTSLILTLCRVNSGA